ncbi:MAG: hypothetical protein MUF87_03460 [Anaerolineae bacterium]|jgi:hypothetical protein|nr:hypothetical protein [Anaerolineae bacterium]
MDTETLLSLHQSLYSCFRKYNITLQAVTSDESITISGRNRVKMVGYLRPSTEAQAVEMMMGRNKPKLELRHHPVIELRKQQEGVVLELVLPPQAWWDQQNLLGKISLERHYHEFYQLIGQLPPHFKIGFWEGTHLDEAHLTAGQLLHPQLFKQWLATFNCGQDWLRIGVWYDHHHQITEELARHAQQLERIYHFIAWKSANDFRTFYNRALRYA